MARSLFRVSTDSVWTVNASWNTAVKRVLLSEQLWKAQLVQSSLLATIEHSQAAHWQPQAVEREGADGNPAQCHQFELGPLA